MRLFGRSSRLDVTVDLFGEVPEARARTVSDAIESQFAASVEVGGRLYSTERCVTDEVTGDTVSMRDAAYDADRDQYDLLYFLPSTTPPDFRPHVWVTDVDLYSSVEEARDFVFGGALPGDHLSVVTTERLATSGGWDETATARLRKQAIKQFGRSLGAGRCYAEDCALVPTSVPRQLDDLAERICPDCRAEIGEEYLR